MMGYDDNHGTGLTIFESGFGDILVTYATATTISSCGDMTITVRLPE
jgi:hypothetical protein